MDIPAVARSNCLLDCYYCCLLNRWLFLPTSMEDTDYNQIQTPSQHVENLEGHYQCDQAISR